MLPADFIIYCKSYQGDLSRAVRLAKSVTAYNKNDIPFYLSCPSDDLTAFRGALAGMRVNLISDEDIAAANPRANSVIMAGWDPRQAQQVIKSELWRAVACKAYLCIDSDSIFLRDFGLADFIHPSGNPYTILHQAKDFLQQALNAGRPKVVHHFQDDARVMQAVFSRQGPLYDYGPTPVIWAAQVWKDLDEQYLSSRRMTLWDAIAQRSGELRWYGEALLRFQSIPIYPIEPLFRVYHYEWQWHQLQANGETDEKVAANYLGVVYQSNWHGKKPRNPIKRLFRKVFGK